MDYLVFETLSQPFSKTKDHPKFGVVMRAGVKYLGLNGKRVLFNLIFSKKIALAFRRPLCLRPRPVPYLILNMGPGPVPSPLESEIFRPGPVPCPSLLRIG